MLRLGRMAFASLAAIAMALTTTNARTGMDHHEAAQQSPQPERLDADLERDLQRVRDATSTFHDVKAARASGYQVTEHCVDSPAGGMGYHYENPALVDVRLEIDRPEILVYAPAGAGRPKLAGVEYIVPYSVWHRDDSPPRILGQALKRSDQLQLWFLHVWVWAANSQGMFANWNPAIRCPPTRH